MKKIVYFALGGLAGISLTLISFSSIIYAFAERGHWAIGGEWLLILIGLPLFGYSMYATGENVTRDNIKKARKVNKERLSRETIKEINEILEREG